MKSIFGTLELRSLNPFPFYLTSVVFSMDWKSRITRQSKIAREVKFVRIAHGGQRLTVLHKIPRMLKVEGLLEKS